MELFDTHAHYNDEKFDNDRDKIIEEIYMSGVTRFVTAGYSIDSSKIAIEISKKYQYIYTIIGISPNDIPENEEILLNQIIEIEKLYNENEKIVGIGEIGLDYHWNKENKELQKIAFTEQIKLANKLDLPIIIHTREAVQDTIDILKNEISAIKKGIFHCCPLNRELVKEALKLGFYISLAGPITFKNSKNADEIIEMIPNNRILIETDSPYLAPEPYRGTRNDSRNIKYIAQKIGTVKNMDIEEVARITYENADRIFNIK